MHRLQLFYFIEAYKSGKEKNTSFVIDSNEYQLQLCGFISLHCEEYSMMRRLCRASQEDDMADYVNIAYTCMH